VTVAQLAHGEEPPVRARGLVKRYGSLVAVDHVDLTVERGDVYGFLGPNGAGKTTTLRMLLGLIRPTSGTVELFGRDPLRLGARALEGVAGFVEGPRFYPYLSGRKNLELLARYDALGAGRRELDEVLDLVELLDRAKDRVGGYSHGMRQRLGIAASLLRRPRLLLLDEPATGLDPAGMRDMRALVKRLAEQGITVLLSSHLLFEVEELCNRVGVVSRGRVVREGRLADLLHEASGTYRLETTDPGRALEIVRTHGFADATRDRDAIRLRATPAAVAELSIALGRSGVGILVLAPEAASLEELFLRLTEDVAEPPAVAELTGAAR
jgi:ABC-2 type transport system ATP-binding protein